MMGDRSGWRGARVCSEASAGHQRGVGARVCLREGLVALVCFHEMMRNKDAASRLMQFYTFIL